MTVGIKSKIQVFLIFQIKIFDGKSETLLLQLQNESIHLHGGAYYSDVVT